MIVVGADRTHLESYNSLVVGLDSHAGSQRSDVVELESAVVAVAAGSEHEQPLLLRVELRVELRVVTLEQSSSGDIHTWPHSGQQQPWLLAGAYTFEHAGAVAGHSDFVASSAVVRKTSFLKEANDLCVKGMLVRL